MQTFCAICLGLAVTLLALPSAALDWEYEHAGGVLNSCLLDDPLHGRLFLGTVEGFHYLDLPSGDWTSRDWPGWIGRQVWSLAWHEEHDQRVITGRENAFFKGYIELSDDLGASEEIVYSSDGGSVTGIAWDPRGADRYYACTWSDVIPGEIVRSVDGGEHWTLLGGTIHYAMTSIDVDSDGIVYVGGSSRVTRSVDGGDSWEGAWEGLPPGYGIYCLAADPELPGHLLASNDLALYETFDGGDHWTELLPASCRNIDWGGSWATIPGGASYVFVAVVTWDDRVLLSRDGGITWEDETGGMPGDLVDLCFSPFGGSLEAFVATSDRGVFRSLVLDPAAVVPPSDLPAVALRCHAPFRRGDALAFRTYRAGNARLAVYEITGRRVATLIDGWVPPGSHQIVWRPAGVACGVYYGRLRTVDGSATARILLVD